MTELEAVNMLLAAVGEAAVSSLETATTVEVTQAKNLLSNVNRAAQQKGWHFNTEWDVVMTRNSENMIPLSNSILSLHQPGQLMTIRGRSGSMFAYDLDNNTFTWTKNLNTAVELNVSEISKNQKPAGQSKV